MIGKRYSRQRELIYRCVRESSAHPTAEMVYDQLKPEHPHLSMGTVYRNLNLLAEEGLLTRMPFSVERYDAALTPHSHFRCTGCACVLDMTLPYDSGLDVLARAESGLQITGHALVFEGLCQLCQRSRDQ